MVPNTCSIPECGLEKYCRGWCTKHYQRWQRLGSPNDPRTTPSQRFWSKVDKSGQCWVWIGWKDKYGYGHLTKGFSDRLTHRISYAMAHGPIAPGLVIDHICHNPACVNPEHLRAATQKQNLENRAGPNVNSKSGVRGVVWDKVRSMWRAQAMHHGKLFYVGLFDTIPEAEAAVIAKRNELFTHNDRDRINS